jgi:prepilin-type N-terminal cleavage/methylation domain-containing protein
MRRNDGCRSAFTVIELLVVVAIIAALMALSAAAVLKFMASQQLANTNSTLNRTQGLLSKQVSAVKDEALRESIPPNVLSYIQTNLAGTDSNATARVRVIYVKLRLRQAFPMNFSEALNPTPLAPLASYQAYLNKLGITGSTGAAHESSACLLMALQRSQSGGGIDPADIGGASALGNFITPNGQTIQALVDAWGSPLYFTRVPTGCPVLNPNGPQPGANDPGDPQGLLNSGSWLPNTCRTNFSTLTQQQLAPASTPVMSYKLAPMIASIGPNKVLEIDPVTFAPTTAGGDDVFSTP